MKASWGFPSNGLYDAAGIMLDHNVLAVRFVPGEKQLLVLTATQYINKLDLTKTGTRE